MTALEDALSHAMLHAADDGVRRDIQKRLARADVRLLARAGDDCLFWVPIFVREEYWHYAFFFMGRLLEFRRIGFYGSEYSMVGFPVELEAHRLSAQQRFSALVLSTDDGMGWLAPAKWEELNEEQRQLCTPKFVEDGLQYDSM